MPVLVIKETGIDTNEKPIWHSVEFYPNNSIRFGLLRRGLKNPERGKAENERHNLKEVTP